MYELVLKIRPQITSDEAMLYSLVIFLGWSWAVLSQRSCGIYISKVCQLLLTSGLVHIRCVNLSGVMVQIEKGAYSVGHSSVKGKVC